MKLTRNMRAIQEGHDFKRWLLAVGSGYYDQDLDLPQNQMVEIPQEHIVADVVNEIYGYKINPWQEVEDRVVLSSRNRVVNKLNEKILDLLEGDEKVYSAINTISKT